MTAGRWIRIILGLLLLVATVAAIALRLGPTGAPDATILMNIRLPRVLLGLLAGAGLAGAGVIFQALLRNPLADPYVLGSSSGALLGVLSVVFLWPSHPAGPWLVPAVAFAGAAGTVILVYALARAQGQVRTETLLLAGVAVTYFLSAAAILLMTIAGRDIYEIFPWMTGTLTENDPRLLRAAGAYILPCLLLLSFYTRRLNLLSLGEETALHLGMEVERDRRWLVVLAALLVGAVVSVTGLIGFVGLIVPHAVRRLVGPDHRLVFPASCLAGGAFLVTCDAAARSLVPPWDMPVGVVTALCGAPFFVWVLWRRRGVQPG